MVVWLCTGFCDFFNFWWVFSAFFRFSVTSLQGLIIGIEKVHFTECIEVIWVYLMADYQIHCFDGGFVTFCCLFDKACSLSKYDVHSRCIFDFLCKINWRLNLNTLFFNVEVSCLCSAIDSNIFCYKSRKF